MENPFCKTVSEPVFENNNIEIIKGKLTDPYKAYIIRYYELFDFHSYKLLLIAVSNKLVVMLKKKYFTGILLIIFFSFAHNNLCGQKNLGFESGLEGWIVSGLVNLETSDCAFKGNHCIKLVSPGAEVFQRISVNPLSLVQLTAFGKSIPEGVQGISFIRFYDDTHNLIVEFRGNSFSSAEYSYTGYYTMAPAKSKYLTYGISKKSAEGIIFGDEIGIQINIDTEDSLKAPIVNLDQYLKPFWDCDTTYNETVLLYSVNGGTPNGKLMFNPSEIISVRSFDLQSLYIQDGDYTLSGNIISKLKGSAIPSRADTSLSNKDLAWYDIQSQWVVVTYIHKDKWKGMIPAFKGDKMPKTFQKLESAAPLKIVAFGMSITRGMDVSGYHNLPPYMPTYVDLFIRQLKKNFGYDNITLKNAGLPGGTIGWAAQYTDEYINPYNPDLIILDFGMNDFWSLTPIQFKNYMQTVIDKCKAHNKNIEIVLISNMKFDPAYIHSDNEKKIWYESNLSGYNRVLQSLCKEGIINLDIYTLSGDIFKSKKAKDCIVNPLHPNDYLARWYAQGLSALFIKN